MKARLTIEGIQELQQANQQMIDAMEPKGALGQAIKYATTEAHRRAVNNTPWETGGLRAAHRIEIKSLTGKVFIDPGATNPRQGGARPAEYGWYLHNMGMSPGIRGGIRAFYQYTVEHDGERIVKQAGKILKKGLP